MARKRKPRAEAGEWRAAADAPESDAYEEDHDALFEMVQATNPERALRIYQRIIHFAKPAYSARDAEAGRMWRKPGARRYLKALFGVASTLRLLDRHKEAVEKFRELVPLDPADRLFCRYWLAAVLLDLNQLDELKELLARHDERTAVWRYAQALLAFRLSGGDDDAERLLHEARELDARFLEYLLGDALVDAERPVRFDGSPGEIAHSCARLFLPAWRSTPGAATWARRTLKVPLRRWEEDEAPSFPCDELRQLPRLPATWQMGLKLLDDDDSSGQPLWILAVANVDEQAMTFTTVIEEEPTPQRVWRELLTAMQHPMEGQPHRPQTLIVPRETYQRAWRAPLEEVSVECVYEEDPQPIGDLTAAMAEVVKDQRLPQLDEDVDPGEFPQTEAVWQADFHHSSMWISNEEVGVQRPWVAVILDKASGFVLSTKLLEGEPAPELLWEYLVRSMAHPRGEPAYRPAGVELADSDTYDFLKPRLAACGVTCVLVDELPELNKLCAALAGSMSSPEKSALADVQDVDAEQMEEFYQAAAHYFNAAPWKQVPGEIPIRIGCRGLDAGDRYAIVIGRTGVQLGLALYDDWPSVAAMLRGWTPPEEMAVLSVMFDEESVMAGADLHQVERNGWPIATPEAYPVAVRVDHKQIRPPSSEELRLLVACLRVLPEFVNYDGKAKTYAVEVGHKSFKLRLAWKSLHATAPPY